LQNDSSVSEIFGGILLKHKKCFCICRLLLLVYHYADKKQWVLGKRAESIGTVQVRFQTTKRNVNPLGFIA